MAIRTGPLVTQQVVPEPRCQEEWDPGVGAQPQEDQEGGVHVDTLAEGLGK